MYVVGPSWQHTCGSALLGFVADDAARVTQEGSVPRNCQDAGMDDAERTAEDVPTATAMDRRAFFRRALLVAGGTVGVMGLAGCPRDGEDSEDDDEQDNEQDGDGGEDQDDDG